MFGLSPVLLGLLCMAGGSVLTVVELICLKEVTQDWPSDVRWVEPLALALFALGFGTSILGGIILMASNGVGKGIYAAISVFGPTALFASVAVALTGAKRFVLLVERLAHRAFAGTKLRARFQVKDSVSSIARAQLSLASQRASTCLAQLRDGFEMLQDYAQREEMAAACDSTLAGLFEVLEVERAEQAKRQFPWPAVCREAIEESRQQVVFLSQATDPQSPDRQTWKKMEREVALCLTEVLAKLTTAIDSADAAQLWSSQDDE